MKKLSLVLVVTIALAGNLRAQLLQFDFYGSPASTSAASTSNSSLVTSSTISADTGLGNAGINNTLSVDFAPSGGVAGSLAQAITANDDLQFTITPTGGPVTITDLSLVGYSRNGSNTEFLLTDSLGNPLAPAIDVTGDTNSTNVLATTLTTPLTISTATQLRFYLFNDVNQSDDGSYNERGLGNSGTDLGADLTINGMTAVPEPSTHVLLGLGLILLLSVQRIRRTNSVRK